MKSSKKHNTALFLNYRDPSEAPPNDSPLLAEFPVYGEQEFAEAAGVDEESLTPPDPPMPLMPNQDAKAAAGDSSTARAAQGGQWDLHGLDAPNDPDPALDPKRLPNDFACIDAFSLDTCKLSPFQHAQTLPKEIFSDHAAAFSKVLGELLEALESGDKRRLSTASRWYCAFPQLMYRIKSSDPQRNLRVFQIRLGQFL